MSIRLKFDPNNWKEIHNYLKEWSKWSKNKGRPDNTDTSIFLVPVIIAMLISGERLEKLTWALIALTIVLTLLTIGLFLKT